MRIRHTTLMSAFLVISATGAANAHPKLLSSSPAANTSVARPNAVQLKFSENLIASMTAADIVMTGMPGIAHHRATKMDGFKGALSPDGKTLIVSRPKPLPVGSYRVLWHAVAVDTHRVAGGFNFNVK